MKRSIGMVVLLYFVTCGIYAFYLLYKHHEELNQLAGNEEGTSAGMTLLLSIVTCGLYTIYWFYKMGENVETIKANNGMPAGNSPIIFLILSICGFGIVNYCLMQDTINKVVEG